MEWRGPDPAASEWTTSKTPVSKANNTGRRAAAGELESEMEKEILENAMSLEARRRKKKEKAELNFETKRSKYSINTLFCCDCDKHRIYKTVRNKHPNSWLLDEMSCSCENQRNDFHSGSGLSGGISLHPLCERWNIQNGLFSSQGRITCQFQAKAPFFFLIYTMY